MDDGKNNDLIGQRVEVDRVRKASHECATRLAVEARIRKRALDDTAKRPIDLRPERAAESRALLLMYRP